MDSWGARNHGGQDLPRKEALWGWRSIFSTLFAKGQQTVEVVNIDNTTRNAAAHFPRTHAVDKLNVIRLVAAAMRPFAVSTVQQRVAGCVRADEARLRGGRARPERQGVRRGGAAGDAGCGLVT